VRDGHASHAGPRFQLAGARGKYGAQQEHPMTDPNASPRGRSRGSGTDDHSACDIG